MKGGLHFGVVPISKFSMNNYRGNYTLLAQAQNLRPFIVIFSSRDNIMCGVFSFVDNGVCT